MDHCFQQYIDRHGEMLNDLDSNDLYRFRIYEDENSPIFQNFINDSEYFKIQHSVYFGKDQKKPEVTNDIAQVIVDISQRKTSFFSSLQQQISISKEVVEFHQKILQGRKDDTMELSINFKTMIVAFFKERQHLNQLNSWEIQHVNEFNRRSPSLKSISIFFYRRTQNNNIRLLCHNLFSSCECMQRILRNRCKIETKLQMIKFIEKLRTNLSSNGHVTKWKDVVNKSV